MSLSVVIAANVIADTTIVALVAFVMSRANRLAPHAPALIEAAAPIERHRTARVTRLPLARRTPAAARS
jgi:hypothetical protein